MTTTDEFGASDARRLQDLRYHWGDAYEITIDPAGKWRALHRTDPAAAPLFAETDEGLRSLIRGQYKPGLRWTRT